MSYEDDPMYYPYGKGSGDPALPMNKPSPQSESIDVSRMDTIGRLSVAIKRIEALKISLKECVEECEHCFVNHYGENPEGGSLPPYLIRAKSLLE